MTRRIENPVILINHWRWLEANGYKHQAASCWLGVRRGLGRGGSRIEGPQALCDPVRLRHIIILLIVLLRLVLRLLERPKTAKNPSERSLQDILSLCLLYTSDAADE